MKLEQSPLLALKDVGFYTPDGRILAKNINLDLNTREVLVVAGANGSGKTTLLDIITGRKTATHGSVVLAIQRSDVSFLPQMQDNYTHIPFSLREIVQISISQEITDKDIVSHGLLSHGQLSLAWNSASGGEKRRTLLTRSLVENPKLLVIDEPFNHLDIETKKIMASSITTFASRKDKSVILSTHDDFKSVFDFERSNLTIKHITL